MDIVERLTLEAVPADAVLDRDRRDRYRFAAALYAGQRVLDLRCGAGSGTGILARTAREVVGVDDDAAAVEVARRTVGSRLANADFRTAEAVGFLAENPPTGFEVVVCFDILECEEERERALLRLRERADLGVQIIASVRNRTLAGEGSPSRGTEFGYDEAVATFASFPATVMVPQYVAQGSLICPPDAHAIEVEAEVDEPPEPECASHLVFCVNCDPATVRGHIRASAAPVPVRSRDEDRMSTLRRENARLARDRLGKGGAAAAAALAELEAGEAQTAELREALRDSEMRIAELAAALAAATVGSETPVPSQVLAINGMVGADAVPIQNPPAALPVAPGEDPNSWEHRRRRAAGFLIPWIEQTVSLEGKTVLEYGCGNAAVSCSFASRAARVIGVDIDPAGIELGNAKLLEHGIDNVVLELHSLESVTEEVAARAGEIDVFLLYAVLEHLTVRERLDLLELARRTVKPDGAIVVCETPNRLIYFDHHTARMPFFHLLPDELALEYRSRSDRTDFTAAIDTAASHGREAGLEAIARWGRGVSFHEFEVVFGDLSRHVIASNYDPLLFGERPVHPDEVILARYLERWRPDLAPVWSRYWLDLILSPMPITKRPPFLRPWTAETFRSAGAAWTRSETVALSAPDSTLAIDLPTPTRRLVVGCAKVTPEFLALSVRPRSTGTPLSTLLSGPSRQVVYASFELPVADAHVTLEVGGECEVVFVGFEA